MKYKEFIIIDDDDAYRQVLARSLSRLDYQVKHFQMPDLALDAVKSSKSLIVLLDLKLENDSGLRWIKKIKQSNNDCYIVLLTGYASISTAVEAIKLGADDYLAKPVTAREILNHVGLENKGAETPINDKPMSVERLEWEHIQKVLNDNDGNISASARALGMHRRTLQRKLSKKPAKN